MRPAVGDLLARPEAAQHVEPLVEHLRPEARVHGLAERGELRLDAADPRREDGAAAAENVEGRDLVSEDVRPPARKGRQVRAQDQPLGARGDRGQRHPRIGGRRAPHERQVVPDEQRLPPRSLRLLGDREDVARVAVGAEVRQAEAVAHRATLGRIQLVSTNYERAFAERPDVYAAWGELLGAIKANMDLRRYELATLAAARRLRSSYCSLAHGKVLLEEYGEPVLEIATDRDSAGLDAVDLAVMDLAERVVDDATKITDADLQRLRDLGLTDAEIMDVILTAAVRSFWTKTLDSLGVQPDATYAEMAPELREVLVVGRPIAGA